MTTRAPNSEPAAIPAAAETALVVLGAWTILVPYAARPLGLGVDVASRIEIVDHVVPGTIVAVLGLFLARSARRDGAAGETLRMIAGGICFLCGFWVLATHVPLVMDAGSGREEWGAAIWHMSTAPLIVILSLFIAFR